MTSLSIGEGILEVYNYNDDFIILKSPSHQSLPLVGKAIYKHNFQFVDEVIATETEILIKLNKEYKSGDVNQFEQLVISTATQARTVRLPIYFRENPDWGYVTQHTGMTMDDYIHRLMEVRLSAAMYGFLPGFVYMRGIPDYMQVPRKATPDIKIPENSFAIGGPYTGIYSLPSPGGWLVLGEVATSIISPHTLPPIRLQIGDRIKIESITKQELDDIKNNKMTLESYNGIL